MANTAFNHDPTITVPVSSVNNRVVTWNGTTGKVFNNTATVTIAAGVVAGVTALTVDNLTIDGNTIISTDTNGNITLTPDGTGSVVMDTMTFNGNLLDVRNNGTASAIRLYCESSNAHYQEIKAAPHGVAATYSIILPGAAPTAAGKVLKSSGSSPYSTLEWGDAAGGTTVNGDTDNGIISWITSSNEFQVESGLLYDGTILTIQKAGVAQLDIDSYSTTNGVPAVLRLRHSNHGTIGSHTLSALDAELANINFEGSSGSAFVRGALISVLATQNWSGSTNGTEMRYYTSPNTGGGVVEVMRMRNDGAITMPKQPAFLAGNTVADTDETGDGTTYTVEFNGVLFDQGSDFASNTFTAPITGKYCLNATVLLNQIAANHTEIRMQIVTSNNTFECRTGNDTAKPINMSLSILANMATGHTATVTVRVSNGSKDVDIYGANDVYETQFGGFLVA